MFVLGCHWWRHSPSKKTDEKGYVHDVPQCLLRSDAGTKSHPCAYESTSVITSMLHQCHVYVRSTFPHCVSACHHNIGKKNEVVVKLLLFHSSKLVFWQCAQTQTGHIRQQHEYVSKKKSSFWQGVQTERNEWFKKQSQGIPHLEVCIVKNRSETKLRLCFRCCLLIINVLFQYLMILEMCAFSSSRTHSQNVTTKKRHGRIHPQIGSVRCGAEH